MSKERGIIFGAESVRGILDGSKTLTRRVLKGAVGFVCSHCGESYSVCDRGSRIIRVPKPCPYGKPGDRLWVREGFREMKSGIDYKADHEYRIGFTWKPSIHMPRKFSRITLEVVSVRVERLHEISEADAKAEGMLLIDEPMHADEPIERYSARARFRAEWEKINGKKHPWASNPWVWRIEFRRVMPA